MMQNLSLSIALAWTLLLSCGITDVSETSFEFVNASRILNIMLLESPDVEFDTTGVRSAVETAVDDVNMDPEVLPGYLLRLLCDNCTDSRVVEEKSNGRNTVTNLFQALLQFPTPVAIVGAASVEDTKLTAEIGQYFNLNMVSSFACLAESIDTTNYFCMLPSKQFLLYGIAGFITHFGWQRAAIITEDCNPYVLDSGDIVLMLQEQNVTVMGNVFIRPGANVSESGNLFSFVPDVHVIVLNTSPTQARNIFCEAMKQQVEYPNYVWITPGWYPNQWWASEQDSMPTGCTLEAFIHGTIAISHYSTNVNESPTTISGMTKQQYNYRNSSYVLAATYDALWTIALALDRVNQTIPTCMNDGNYHTSVLFEDCYTLINKLIQAEIERTDFVGVSGPISFKNRGRILDYISVLQYRKVNGSLTRVKIAQISKAELEFEYDDNESDTTVWPEGIPPDGTPFQISNQIYTAILVLVYISAIGCIIFALVCLGFNIAYRNRRLVQLTSPRLNYVLIVGTMLLNVSVFAYAYPPHLSLTSYTVLCPLRSWLPNLGYDFCFGIINVKMFRVYYIFYNPHTTKKRDLNLSSTIVTVFLSTVSTFDSMRQMAYYHTTVKKVWKDWHLMIAVIIFFLIDCITLTVVTAIPKERNSPRIIPDVERQSSINERGVREEYTVLQCSSASFLFWLIPIFSYKILLQIMAVFLAFRIRNVKIKGLNEAKEIKRIVYITSLILLVVMIENFVFSQHINIHAAVYGFGLTAGSVVVLGFTFIPKMIGLYRDPRGEKIFESGPATSTSILTQGEDSATTVAILKRKVEELEMQIVQYKADQTESGVKQIQ